MEKIDSPLSSPQACSKEIPQRGSHALILATCQSLAYLSQTHTHWFGFATVAAMEAPTDRASLRLLDGARQSPTQGACSSRFAGTRVVDPQTAFSGAFTDSYGICLPPYQNTIGEREPSIWA